MKRPNPKTAPADRQPSPKAPEHERARWWRENVMKMSRRALAEELGMSESRISDIEAGVASRSSGEAIDPALMTRHRLACAALPNCFMDLSIRQFDYMINPKKFYEWLRDLIDWSGAHKIFFASDRPLPTYYLPTKDWVKVFDDPQTDIEFTREERDLILGKAAAAVFDCK